MKLKRLAAFDHIDLDFGVHPRFSMNIGAEAALIGQEAAIDRARMGEHGFSGMFAFAGDKRCPFNRAGDKGFDPDFDHADRAYSGVLRLHEVDSCSRVLMKSIM
jgi:hypothetical protein